MWHIFADIGEAKHIENRSDEKILLPYYNKNTDTQHTCFVGILLFMHILICRHISIESYWINKSLRHFDR